jgi:ferredoxin--NADP+ reductase
VIGVGNVAVDVARVLCRTPAELARTDIAGYAEEALARSGVREVYLMGRRGPVQAAFTTPEVRELGELEGADVAVPADEVRLDPVSEAELARADDRALNKKVEVLQEFSRRERTGKPRLLTLRFLVSPVELLDDGHGGVGGMRLVRNQLVDDGKGGARAVATGEMEELPVDLVFRSVGYRGVGIPGLPFDEGAGIVPNQEGRVTLEGRPAPGLFVSGWIKRGPTGVIGTNKPDGAETAERIVADWTAGTLPRPAAPEPEAAEATLRARQANVITYADWCRVDEAELARGQAAGRPRVKFCSVEEMLEMLAVRR